MCVYIHTYIDNIYSHTYIAICIGRWDMANYKAKFIPWCIRSLWNPCSCYQKALLFWALSLNMTLPAHLYWNLALTWEYPIPCCLYRQMCSLSHIPYALEHVRKWALYPPCSPIFLHSQSAKLSHVNSTYGPTPIFCLCFCLCWGRMRNLPLLHNSQYLTTVIQFLNLWTLFFFPKHIILFLIL